MHTLKIYPYSHAMSPLLLRGFGKDSNVKDFVWGEFFEKRFCNNCYCNRIAHCVENFNGAAYFSSVSRMAVNNRSHVPVLEILFWDIFS